MAKNDVVLLDGIIDQRLAEGLPSSERDEVFEFLCLEQLLKDYDLSRDEVESGWIDGRDDGGPAQRDGCPASRENPNRFSDFAWFVYFAVYLFHREPREKV